MNFTCSKSKIFKTKFPQKQKIFQMKVAVWDMKDLDPASHFVTDLLWNLEVDAVNLRSTSVQRGFSALLNDCKSQATSILQGPRY